jgi:hypothetical protein
MPIDVDGGLISLGGRASDSRRSMYRQPGQPGERLNDHEDAQGAGDPRHPLDSPTVLLAQRLVAVASRGKPPERVGLRLGRGLLVELVVELLRVDRELEVPRCEQDRRGDEAQNQRAEGNPSPCLESGLADRGGSAGRRPRGRVPPAAFPCAGARRRRAPPGRPVRPARPRRRFPRAASPTDDAKGGAGRRSTRRRPQQRRRSDPTVNRAPRERAPACRLVRRVGPPEAIGPATSGPRTQKSPP